MVPILFLSGDFEEIYGAADIDEDEPQAGQWDAILTCFFIDTVCHRLAGSITDELIKEFLGKEHRQLPSHPASDSCTRWYLDQSW